MDSVTGNPAEDARLLREAVALLRDARCRLIDPGVRRTWGARRRRVLDAVLNVEDADGGR